MSLFDKILKKNTLENVIDQKLEDGFEFIAENNPVMKKAKSTVAEGEEQITRALERELYKATGELPERRPSENGAEGDVMREWGTMFDQFFDQELSSIKICPSCGEAAPAELDRCPHCGAQLPETTAKEYVDSF